MLRPKTPGAPPLSPEERRAYRVGRRAFERGDTEAALAHLTRLLETRPRFADVHYMVGLLHEGRGDLSAAVRSLEQALRINPAYTEARLALATVSEQQGDFERCREISESWARDPSSGAREVNALTQAKLANLQATLGDAYHEAGEFRDAIDAYRKALARCPAFHDVRHRLALVLREAGLPHQAIRELERVLRVHPGFLDSAVQLGLTYFMLGRARQAVQQWKWVLEQDPSHADARMYLRLVQRPRSSVKSPRATAPPSPLSPHLPQGDG